MSATPPSSPIAAPYPRLLGDIGGTHARLAWIAAPGDPLTAMATYAADDHPGLESVLQRHRDEHRLPAPAACALGIATPLVGDAVTMTNRDWRFSITALQAALGVERLVVVNDFAALALGLASLTAEDLLTVGGGRAVVGEPVGLLGAGTGLGVAGLVHVQGRVSALATEGGHATLAGADAEEDRLLARLRERYGHVSAERVLSGPGLVALHQAICAERGREAQPLAPAEVTARAMTGNDLDCVATVDSFLALLGSFAGNLALTLGARGGVYVGGGIVPRLGDRIVRSRFRERFEQKGRYRSWLAAIPTLVVRDAGVAALRGADRALDG